MSVSTSLPGLERLLEDEIKVEEDMDQPRLDQRLDFPSWDSGVVMDTNTVVQMAEFQEVVDSLQRGIPPPPPYPYCTLPPTTITVTPAPSPPDRDLEHLLNSAPVLRGGGVMSYHGQLLGPGRLVGKECQSLPAFNSDGTGPNVVDRVDHKYAVTSRYSGRRFNSSPRFTMKIYCAISLQYHFRYTFPLLFKKRFEVPFKRRRYRQIEPSGRWLNPCSRLAIQVYSAISV